MTVPNRREPITKVMILHWCKVRLSHPPDSLESALADWMILGAYAGFRKSEWIQDHYTFHKKHKFNENVDGSSKAFIFNDFTFFHRPDPKDIRPILTQNQRTNCVTICWRFQKNGQNGECVTFTENYLEPQLSQVRAAQRIIQRAVRLKVPKNNPIAVFSSSHNTCTYLTHIHAQKNIRAVAKACYSDLDAKNLNKFTCHSVRVGACVTLHIGGANEHDIKHRLRWRSNSFMMYLRSMPQIAARHNSLFNQTDPDSITIPELNH